MLLTTMRMTLYSTFSQSDCYNVIIFLFRLGREGRQAELQKLRKEEKRLRGDGRLVEMAGLIGSKSQVCFFKHLIMSVVSSVLFFSFSPWFLEPLLVILVNLSNLNHSHAFLSSAFMII